MTQNNLRKVSDLIAEFLEQKQIKHVFGIIGSGNAHIFDSIYHRGYTEIVCVHHEQAAVMAAGTYYRTTGKATAVLLTTGAGSLNGITGDVSLWMDSIPCLILSGNENSKFTIPENKLRIWGIQGYNSTKVVEDYNKYTMRVMQPSKINFELSKAYDIATTGRPGPVWLDVPMNIQAATVESGQLESYVVPQLDSFKPTKSVKTFEEGLDQIVAGLKKAKRPVIWLGHGIRLAGGVDLIEPLLKNLNAPALITWNGMDMLDSDHPSLFGRAGIYGQRAANFVLQNCDYLLTIGTRLALPQVGYEIKELARDAQIACVDIDPLEVEKYSERFQTCLTADAKEFMTKLLKKTEPLAAEFGKSYGDWWKQCRQYKESFPWVGPEHADKDGFINSYPFMEKLSKYLKKDSIVVTDMGTALLSGHQVLKMKDQQRMMTSTGLGEMGFGLPAAMGASFGKKNKNQDGEVICLNCDGGMMMNLQELQTIAHHQLPIKIIIFNNDGYLMIKHTQKALFKGRYSGTDQKSGVTCPDYTKLAKAFDYESFQIRSWADFESEMPKVMATKGPTICEVFMHPEQLLVPKLSLAPQKDGSIVSPPLEDLFPFLDREVVRKNMIIGMHPKSEQV
jgi:acetolactate synthase-1/2/3 large subunit